MANLALIRGAAMAAPKFTDIRAAVEPGIQTFKNIQSLRQKEIEEDKIQKEREDAIKQNLYANLPGLQSDIVPDNFKKDATALALDIKNEQKRLIQNKENMDQYEFIDQMRLLNDKVANINKDFQTYKEWSGQWVDLKEADDLSSAMSAKQRKTIIDIVTGQAKPVRTEEGLGYEVDGEIHLLKNLPKPIEIEYKLHNQMETDMLNLGAKFGAQGRGADDELYKKQKQLALTNLRRGLTREKALSLASDFLKIGGDQGEQAGILQEFIDNPNAYTYIDPEEGKMQGLDAFKEYIVDQYSAIADSTVNSEKAIYDKNKKLQEKIKTPDQYNISGQKLAFDLITDPISRFQEITTMPSNYDEKTGIFSFEETEGEGDNAKTITREYNMTSAPDIIRLARQVLDNEGETAANKSKMIAGLKEFLLKNKTGLESMADFYSELDREERVSSVVQQLDKMQNEQFIPPHLRNTTNVSKGSGNRARTRAKSNN